MQAENSSRDRQGPVYELTLGKGSPRLKPLAEGRCTPVTLGRPSRTGCGCARRAGRSRHLSSHSGTTRLKAGTLQGTGGCVGDRSYRAAFRKLIDALLQFGASHDRSLSEVPGETQPGRNAGIDRRALSIRSVVFRPKHPLRAGIVAQRLVRMGLFRNAISYVFPVG